MKPMPINRTPWRFARWLILAPHPDDETLGAGTLLHHAAEAGQLAGLVYLTDGGGSHPEGTARLRSVRRREASLALRRLSGQRIRPDWMGWHDGHPHASNSIAFHRSALRLAAMIRARQVSGLAVSDPGDEHCDHVAAFELARAACGAARSAVQLFTYSVWHGRICEGCRVRSEPMPLGLRRSALAAHRSQLTGRMGAGFRLPAPMRVMRCTDMLTAVGWPR
jgi:N-acetylglucosamine malate deacetylase 1